MISPVPEPNSGIGASQLPSSFEEYRHRRLIKRIPTIGWAGILIFIAYAVLDYCTLPEAVSRITVGIRLLIVCPMIFFVMIGAKLQWPIRFFALFYLLAYIVSGLAIVAIIYLARTYSYDLPYDGLLLLLVFGYFLMGMPQSHAAFGSLLVSFGYFLAIHQLDTPTEQIASNALFIMTLNVLGILGSAIQERSRRQLFRHEQLVAQAQAKDQQEISFKTELLATASHDLRQPLHAMNLLIETLEEQLHAGEQRHLATQLKESTRQLNSMLGSLLNMSRLQTGIIETSIRPFDLAERIQLLVRELDYRARQCQMRIEIEGPDSCWVNSDPVLIERILRNVCENSFVHAKARCLKVRWSSQGEQILLEVMDDGIGINSDQADQIFEAFHRIDKDKTSSGMGLGLAIVRQLCQMLNIEQGLKSTPEQGACFWFCLPIASPVLVEEENKALSNDPERDERHIVVVDDDQMVLDSTAQLLQNWGFRVTTYVDPALALEELGPQAETKAKTKIAETDLLICDYQFSQLKIDGTRWDGVTLVEELRETIRRDLPVVFVTADTLANLSAIVSERFTQGHQQLTEVVHKPFAPAKLRLIIRHFLEKQTNGIAASSAP